ATGRLHWSQAITPAQPAGGWRDMRRNDLLLAVGDTVQLMLTRMDPKTGEFRPNPTNEFSQAAARRRVALLSNQKNPAKAVPPEENIAPPIETTPGIGLEGFIAPVWPRLGDRKYQ